MAQGAKRVAADRGSDWRTLSVWVDKACVPEEPVARKAAVEHAEWTLHRAESLIVLLSSRKHRGAERNGL